jgi:NAD(P)-dependent dehydrogenase (short-subunit alcohol dehydrogenase family)
VTRVTYDFSGSVVLVTGGASGIGAATARACAAAGATVFVADVNELKSEGIASRRVDVADPRAVKNLIQEISEKHGRIDAAVLAAAIQRRTPIESTSDADWRRHMGVNLDGVFYCMREIAPVMKRQRHGAMLTFTSGLVNLGWPGAGPYAASKGALIGLAKCAAQELRPYGVRVNVLSPGLVATPIFLDVASADERAMYESSVGVSQPEDVVPTVLYLISDGSTNLTGAVIERRLVPGQGEAT